MPKDVPPLYQTTQRASDRNWEGAVHDVIEAGVFEPVSGMDCVYTMTSVATQPFWAGIVFDMTTNGVFEELPTAVSELIWAYGKGELVNAATFDHEAARRRMRYHAEKGHWSTWPLDEMTDDVIEALGVVKTAEAGAETGEGS